MITKKRKIIYGAVIAVLVLAIIGVIFYSRQPVPSTNLSLSNPLSQTNAPQASGSAAYILPKVFPNDTKFDLSFFQSSFFGELQPSEEVRVEGSELGRDNPFKKY